MYTDAWLLSTNIFSRIGEGGQKGTCIVLGSLECILAHAASQYAPAATPTMLWSSISIGTSTLTH